MSQTGFRATVIRIHNDHGISCSTETENKLIESLENLQMKGRLTKGAVVDSVNALSAQFYKENGLDSPEQYARLLWDGISVARPDSFHPGLSQTNFYGPITQTGIFQTGAGSTALWLGNNQILEFRQAFSRALEVAKQAAEAELVDEQKAHALTIIDVADEEAKKPEPDRSKMKRLLTPMLKWTGERFTAAIDGALAAVVASTLKPGA